MHGWYRSFGFFLPSSLILSFPTFPVCPSLSLLPTFATAERGKRKEGEGRGQTCNNGDESPDEKEIGKEKSGRRKSNIRSKKMNVRLIAASRITWGQGKATLFVLYCTVLQLRGKRKMAYHADQIVRARIYANISRMSRFRHCSLTFAFHLDLPPFQFVIVISFLSLSS